ncbi:MAG: hypothetical protein R6W78_00725 [Bacteroidales bacterium]
MKYLISTILLGTLISGQIYDTGFREILVENSEKYNSTFPSEHVYIITDKEFYRPGEELWFKAIANNTLSGKQLSSDINIKLLDVFGKQVLNIRYPLIDNECKGYLMLPVYLTEGRYRLVGYTGWMKNLPVSRAFCKDIIISQHIDRQFILDVTFPENLYYPGSKVLSALNLTLPNGQPMAFTKFSYKCRSAKMVYYNGRATTDERGYCKLSFELPSDTDCGLLWLEFEIKQKKKTEIFIYPLPVRKKTIEIRFLPEGGNLIAGLENKVAFKAVDSYGFPQDVEGYLMDETGKQIDRIKSDYMGLGAFTFIPGQHQYQFRVIKPVTESVLYPLPEVSSGGIILNYSGTNADHIVFLLQSTNEVKKIKVNFVAEQNGRIIWTSTTEFTGSHHLRVPSEKFTEGIIKCTLLDDSANTIASRIIAARLRLADKILEVNIFKDIYQKRDKAFIELKNTSLSDISVAISVCKSNYLDKNHISLQDYFSYYIWLRDALPDYFENFLSDDYLDLIMLTHSARSLPLSGIYNYGYKYSLPYFNHDGITGQVYDKKNNLLENATVKVIHTPDLRTFQASSDARGIFNIKFDNRIINYNLLNVAIADETGRSIENYTIYDPYSGNLLDKYVAEKEAWQFEQLKDLLNYRNPMLLYSGKYSHGNEKRKKEFTGKGYNYKKYSLYKNVADIISELKSYNLVNGEIVFVGHEHSTGTPHGALIVVDGIALGTSAGILDSISPKVVQDISVSTSPSVIQRYSARNSMGVIEIYTLRGLDNRGMGAIHDIQKDILMLGHEFSGPDYSLEDIPGDDIRTTLFWKPDLTIAGKSTEIIAFYTSDTEGKYICTFTTTDKHGNRFTKSIPFSVK